MNLELTHITPEIRAAVAAIAGLSSVPVVIREAVILETSDPVLGELLRMLAMDKAAIEEELDRLELDRDALIAERDAWHWTIQDRCNQGNMTYSVFEEMNEWQARQPEIAADAKPTVSIRKVGKEGQHVRETSR